MHKYVLIGLLLSLSLHSLSAQDAKKNKGGTSSPSSIEVLNYRFMQPNSVRAWFGNDARSFQNAQDASGFEWPAGTGKTAVFLASPWVAAQFEGNPSDIRTAAVQNIGQNGTEFRPGKILRSGNTLVPDDPSLARYRVYYIRRGDNATTNPDYAQWPVADGAPVDANGNPLITGSESMWYVANDLSNRRFSSQPLGCELQQYMYGFVGTNPVLNNTIFIQYRFINRNIPNPQNPNAGLWKNAYVAIFNDSDIGDAGDDVVGCDTLNGLAYTYNGVPSDPIYGSPPPAVGYVFLGGRVGSSPITLSAHVRFDNASGPTGDPETGRPDHVYNSMRGLDKNGNPVGNTVPGSRFMFPGDPETGQGIIETQVGDKRSVLAFGPFDVRAGDTVEILHAVTIAQGTSHLNSVTVLKQQAAAIRSLFNAPSSASRLFAYLNRRINPSANQPFTIVVEAQDAVGFPRPVSQNTTIQLSLTSGSGTLSGTLNRTIPAGQSSVSFDGLTYNQVENGVQVTVSRTSGDNLSPTTLSFNVVPSATSLSVSSPSQTVALIPNLIEVSALTPNNTLDSNFSSNITLNILNGPGSLIGQTTVTPVFGLATFVVAFSRAGSYTLQATGGNLTSQPFTVAVRPNLITSLVPQVAKIPVSGETSILPHCYLFEVRGLAPNTTYRYRATTVASSNFIVPNPNGFTRFTPPYPSDLSDKFGLFTTDANGSYKGWVIFEATASGNLSGSLSINDGSNSPTVDYTLSLSPLTIGGNSFGTTGLRATAVIGLLPATLNTISTARKIIALYDNVDGIGRPLTTTYVEDDNTPPTDYPTFYQQSVNALNGRFGTLVRNQLPNGIRRLELYDLNGTRLAFAVSPNGVWGTTNTVNPNGGDAQPLVIDFTTALSTPNDGSPVKKPTEYALMQNYPNPFNPTTVIRYQLPTASWVRLEVFDVLGKQVASLVNSAQAAGDYSVTFNASNLASGVYFYRLQAGSFVQTKKMLLIK